MANENKKAIRARVAALQNESDEALLELWHGQLTRTDMAAIERIMNQRGVKLPEEHGPVTDDPTQTHVITAEDLKEVPTEQVKKKRFMGPLEVITFVLGVAVAIYFWPRDPGIAIGYGAGGAMVLYAVLNFLRKTFMSLDQTGKQNQVQKK